MLVVHVSGVSGCGKTHVVRVLNLQYSRDQVVAVDTDEFIDTPSEFSGPSIDRSTSDYLARYTRHMQTHYNRCYMDALDRKTRVLVFAGLLDNCAPTPSSPDSYVAYEPEWFEFDLRLYIDAPLDLVVQQRRRRNDGDQDRFEKEFIAKDLELTRAWHLQHGYRMLSQQQVLDTLAEMLASPE